jgi:copper transport protein
MRWKRLLFATATAFLLSAGLALPASGHALIRATTPSDSEELDSAPTEVLLEFNEPVTANPGAVRVFDTDGERVDVGDAQVVGGTELRVGLQPDTPQGTYIVSWRATSADAHPVHGAFVYSVGPAGQGDETAIAEILQGDDDGTVQAVAAIARFLQYAGALLAAGGVAFLVWVHDRVPAEQRALTRLLFVAALVTIAVTVVGFGLQAMLVTGLGLRAVVSASALASVAGSSYGLGTAVLLVGLVVLVVAVRRLWDRWAVAGSLGGAGLVLGSFALSGHSANTSPGWLVVAADLAHVLAGAAWFGGLVLLLVALRRRRAADDAIGGGTMVGRFSTMAVAAVALATVAGVALSWAEVRASRALFSTAYGWTLLVKLGIVAAVVAMGAYNQRRLIPALRRAQGAPWPKLRRVVRAEVVGLCALLVVTAVLVNLVPARDAAGITGPLSVRAEAGPNHLLDITVEPNRAGRNEMHLYLFTDDGRPAKASDVLVTLSMPAKDIGPIEREPTLTGPGHWTLSGAELPLPGRWNVGFTAAVSKFNDATAQVPIDVGG